MATNQFFPIQLTNQMMVPKTKNEAIDLLESLRKTLHEMEEEKENPILVFKQSMEEGFLFSAALKDATNCLTVYANLYQSIKELEYIIANKNWDL